MEIRSTNEWICTFVIKLMRLGLGFEFQINREWSSNSYIIRFWLGTWRSRDILFWIISRSKFNFETWMNTETDSYLIDIFVVFVTSVFKQGTKSGLNGCWGQPLLRHHPMCICAIWIVGLGHSCSQLNAWFSSEWWLKILDNIKLYQHGNMDHSCHNFMWMWWRPTLWHNNNGAILPPL